MTDCSICKRTDSVEELPTAGMDGRHIKCPHCGEYKVTGSAEACIHSPNVKLSAWVRDQNEHDQKPTISSYTLGEVNKLPEHSVLDKQALLLRAIQRRTKSPGWPVRLDADMDFPLVWAANPSEFCYYLESLLDQKLLEKHPKGANKGGMQEVEEVILTPKAWERLAKFEKEPAITDQAFVAMWFDAEMDDAWEQGIKPAIEQAGYRPIRVDKEPHIDRIDAKIVADIKDSRFLIADVTGQRAGVYFEAGYAIGLGRPVIWCVRKDQLDEVHFDTRQYNHIVWETPEELKEKLYQLIRAVIGARK